MIKRKNKLLSSISILFIVLTCCLAFTVTTFAANTGDTLFNFVLSNGVCATEVRPKTNSSDVYVIPYGLNHSLTITAVACPWASEPVTVGSIYVTSSCVYYIDVPSDFYNVGCRLEASSTVGDIGALIACHTKKPIDMTG